MTRIFSRAVLTGLIHLQAFGELHLSGLPEVCCNVALCCTRVALVSWHQSNRKIPNPTTKPLQPIPTLLIHWKQNFPWVLHKKNQSTFVTVTGGKNRITQWDLAFIMYGWDKINVVLPSEFDSRWFRMFYNSFANVNLHSFCVVNILDSVNIPFTGWSLFPGNITLLLLVHMLIQF